jgi:hypothetical protein
MWATIRNLRNVGGRMLTRDQVLAELGALGGATEVCCGQSVVEYDRHGNPTEGCCGRDRLMARELRLRTATCAREGR